MNLNEYMRVIFHADLTTSSIIKTNIILLKSEGANSGFVLKNLQAEYILLYTLFLFFFTA